MYRKIKIGKYYLDLYRCFAVIGAALVVIVLLTSLIKGASKKDSNKTEEIVDTSNTIGETYVRQILGDLPSLEMLSNIAHYKPVTDLKWSDIDESELNSLNGLNYWDELPDIDYGQCTGYVSWAMTNVYEIEDYPHTLSYYENRNGGEYVDAHRIWLVNNATLIGGATTEDGEIKYYGAKYVPGDIIVFNSRADGDAGELIEQYAVDTWGEYDEDLDEVHSYFVHIGIVGSDRTLWIEDIDRNTGYIDPEAKAGGTLPDGQLNMHHDIESHLGVVDMLSPEQFITRAVPADDDDYSRSYEIYRVLALESIDD